MNLKDCRKAYVDFSTNASELGRKLAFSGIAIIWVFRTEENSTLTMPDELISPGFYIVLSLAFDLMQYLAGTLAWGIYGRYKELKGVDDQEFKAPRSINWATNFFFIAKFVAIGTGYFLLLEYLYTHFA